MAAVDSLLNLAVERVAQAGGDPNDALRGLVFSAEDIEAELARNPLNGWWDVNNFQLLVTTPPETPLANLIANFHLNALDIIILLLCLAPELDRRYERIYGFLQDDVTLRRPTLHLIMNLIGSDLPARFEVWERLQPSMPLVAHKIIDVLPDASRVYSGALSLPLKIDAHILSILLGIDGIDARIKDAVTPINVDTPPAAIQHHNLKALDLLYEQWDKALMVAFSDPPISDGGLIAQTLVTFLCHENQQPLVRIDAARLAQLDLPLETAWQLALREGALHNAVLLISHWEDAFKKRAPMRSESEETVVAPERIETPAQIWSMLTAYPRSVMLSQIGNWEPQDQERQRRVLRIHLDLPTYQERRAIWDELLQPYAVNIPPEQLEEISAKFRFSPLQISLAVQTAADFAASHRDEIQIHDLYAGAQAHSALRLGKLARRVTPKAGWNDLILPPDYLIQLHEITQRARYSEIVHEVWGFNKKISNLSGVSALFAGESGTGKTLAAEVIAHEIGLPLYTIDLSAVVSKYIGETEKNLNLIFEEARASNAILFFDEADAMFGKRSEVKDAHDRYANIEVAYLLQQIETYDGVAIMATNLRQNIDDAFTRRIDFLIDFPFPDSEYRERLWKAHFPPEAPLSDDVDLRAIASQFRLAGGNIRNAAIASAFFAAADGGIINMNHIRSAIRREHQKMGRLLDDL
ncbi:MAG TPA: ATP-binding protein [Phototrophicaceae bacterium]|nr:ATP-binding protein [Phototrophicaceae bacterium]